ncbi:MAG: hypothetical protein Unbinned3065contig1007_36 [Prokaryotic dsDNA virus sp.]|nr:MAG: hypothetical protein Unbinned3065contig1007_36 [Prokaryotic dsDNA virus sp.]|tara:strand:- start:4452 stop:5156 length:705 start_codon:yes stop_codon:yes gene_type:complete
MKLGLSLGLEDNATALTWEPTDESSCLGWYKYGAGFTLVSDAVSVWNDQSSASNDATQTDAANRPDWNKNAVEFDGDTGGDPDHLDIPQVTLTGDLTVAVSIDLNAMGGVLLGDNDASNTEFIRFTATTELRVRNQGNTAINLDLTNESFNNRGYLVVSRSTVGGVANTWQMWWNGVKQTSTAVMNDTCLYDVIGVRKPDNNALDGNIYELQIFNSASDALTDNINLRLGTLPL